VKPRFLVTPAAWRSWLEKNHDKESELLVGFYKTKAAARKSITWPESVDQALCFGWIDGLRKRIDDESYSIRFTPRKPRSVWSVVNTNRVAELSKLGVMHSAGLKAFESRTLERNGIYSFEQENIQFESEHEELFRADSVAWEFFRSQPAWYRRTATWRVVSAKKPETRMKRLTALIEVSRKKLTIAELTRK
jgi:uncharacterized protein YdeI (YjbR/CyaY-like superfamily)